MEVFRIQDEQVIYRFTDEEQWALKETRQILNEIYRVVDCIGYPHGLKYTWDELLDAIGIVREVIRNEGVPQQGNVDFLLQSK